nr:rep protein [Cressdnaviricota sp.]UOF77176.1 rep protein [Cressdnaviricota sp.]
MQARVWCFTLNNPTEEEINTISNLESEVPMLVVGHEIGENGTPHLQGTIGLNAPWRFDRITAALGGRAHVERCKNIKKSMEYCRKEHRMLCDKDERAQGERTELYEFADSIHKGADERELALKHPREFLKYSSGMKRMRTAIQAVQDDDFVKPEVIVVTGPPGCGKTRLAMLDKPYRVLTPSKGGEIPWFDGYAGERTILFDDFRGEVCYSWLLQALDGYRLTVPIKGGHVHKNWTKVWLTTNCTTLQEMYPSKEIGPLERRVTKIIAM